MSSVSSNSSKYLCIDDATTSVGVEEKVEILETEEKILDIIKKNTIPVHTIIEGEACSAATLIALAGTERYMTENSMILVHQLRTWFSGKHNELEDELKSADKMMKSLKAIYTKHTKLTQSELSKLIQREEYLTSHECLSKGFVDKIV